MIDIKSYMNDGACWQAQAVLACLRYEVKTNLYKFGDGQDAHEPIVQIGRYENGREQGYVVRLMIDEIIPMASYCFYEHRNSDQICVIQFQSAGYDTPSLDTIWLGRENKYDYDKEFGYAHIEDCAEYIINDMKRRWLEFKENVESIGTTEALRLVRAVTDAEYMRARKAQEAYEKGEKLE